MRDASTPSRWRTTSQENNLEAVQSKGGRGGTIVVEEGKLIFSCHLGFGAGSWYLNLEEQINRRVDPLKMVMET